MKKVKLDTTSISNDEQLLMAGLLPVGVYNCRKNEVVFFEYYHQDHFIIPQGILDRTNKIINESGRILKISY